MRPFAETLRTAGHTVHAPDVFDGRVFDSIDEGMAFAEEAGFETLVGRGAAAAEGIGPDVVYAGFSFGVMPAQQLAQTRAAACGALLPVHLHRHPEDMDAARALVDSTDGAELFLYPGHQHLLADPLLPAYDAEAARLLTERVLAFLEAVDGTGR